MISQQAQAKGKQLSKNTVPGLLYGITVVDLTRVLAGPYCTMVLADLGARVIKVEMPGKGDDARAFGPFLPPKSGDGVPLSAYFASLNRNKLSIALNLKDAGDRDIFEALLAKADVLVENYRPGVMEKLGYGWDRLHARFPQLIYAATSGFGQTGPYRDRAAYDMVVQAMGGIMSITGHPGGDPVRVGSSIGDITAGLFTAVGINAALFDRTRTGEGKMIDVSMLDCQVAILENAIARYEATGQTPGPLGARHPSITPFAAYATADGHLVLAAGNDALFQKLCEALGRPDLLDNPAFANNNARTENGDRLAMEIESALSHHGSSHWLSVLEQAGVPCGPINTVPQALSDPQIVARNMVVSADDPDYGPLRMGGNPIKVNDADDPETRRPAPRLDGDRVTLLADLDLDDA